MSLSFFYVYSSVFLESIAGGSVRGDASGELCSQPAAAVYFWLKGKLLKLSLVCHAVQCRTNGMSQETLGTLNVLWFAKEALEPMAAQMHQLHLQEKVCAT